MTDHTILTPAGAAPPLPPVVQLIAQLLLVWGAWWGLQAALPMVLELLVNQQLLADPGHIMTGHLLADGPRPLFMLAIGMATLVAGAGLRAQTPWGWRWAITTLATYGFIAFGLGGGGGPLRDLLEPLAQCATAIVIGGLLLANNLARLLAEAKPSATDETPEPDTAETLTRLTQIPLVKALLALPQPRLLTGALLVCFGVEQCADIRFGIIEIIDPQAPVTPLPQPVLQGLYILLPLLLGVMLIVAGIGLLCRRDGAPDLAVRVLAVVPLLAFLLPLAAILWQRLPGLASWLTLDIVWPMAGALIGVLGMGAQNLLLIRILRETAPADGQPPLVKVV